jgi:hypothetical protein
MKHRLQHLKLSAITAFFLINTALFAQCPSEIVSYWNLDESGSATYVDQISGHNALAENSPTNTTGIVGNAKYFDGTKRVSVSTHTDYNFANNQGFTIALWARFTDVTFGTYNKVLIGKNEPYATTGAKWWISSQLNSGLMGFYLEDSNGAGYDVSAPAINDNSWHFIVAVRNPADNTIKLYIDGNLANSASASYSGDFSSSAPIQIGYLNRLSIPDYWYKGALDEIAIYSRVLDPTEITEQWTKGTLGIGYCDGYSPTIKSEPVLTAAVGQEYTYDVQASGMPPITYSLDASPSGMSINSTTGLITWIPGSTNDDSFVRVIASNPSYPPDAIQEFTINVAEAPSCPSGLIGLWKFDETSGPIYADHYGIHDAVADISPTPTTGIVNGAQTFDNTTTVNLPDDGAWEWANDASFSLEVWIKTTNTANTDMLVFIGRLRHDEWFTNWWVGMDGNEYPVFYLRDSWGNEGMITGSTSLANGLWHHVVAVRDGTAKLNKLYVDGVKVNELSITYPHSFTRDANDSIPVNIGWFDSGLGHRFTGAMDELAIFNRALTDTDVSRFFNGRNPDGHCAPGNYAPIITSEPVTVATEDELYEYVITADDFDATDILFFTAVTKPSWLDFSHTLGQRQAILSGIPENEDVGDTIVTLRVSDGEIDRDQTYTLSVNNVNDPPEITSTPSTSVDQDSDYSYTVVVEDVDVGDELTVTVPTKPDWLIWDEQTLTLSGTPTYEDVGDNAVSVSVTDGTATITQDFTIEVVAGNVAPQITGQVPLSVYNDETLTLSLDHFTVVDPDNTYPDDFTLIVLNGSHYSVSGSTITPEAEYTGNINVGVQVNDGMASSPVYYALVEVLVTSIDNGKLSQLVTVYPNPAYEFIYFRFNDRMTGGIIEIWNSIGSLVKQVAINGDLVKIDASELNQGSFIYRIFAEDELIIGRFTVIRNQ